MNSNNLGGINPSSGMMVDVELGEEYITELAFDPNALTLLAVPEPSSLTLWVTAGLLILGLCRRSSRKFVKS